MHGRHCKATVTADVAERPVDLVQRDLSAERPNQLWVSDFAYILTWRGSACLAVATATFSRGSRAGV